MQTTDDDAQIMADLQGGNSAALEYVYRTYKDNLLTLAACMLGDRHSAEDVLQDVFVSLVRRLGDLQLSGSLRSYLVTCCANRSRDLLRQRLRRQQSPVAAYLGTLDGSTVATEPPAEIADEVARALAALAELPNEQREVVTLHIHGQMKFREIAELLNVSIDTIKSRYRLALQAMRVRLMAERKEL